MRAGLPSGRDCWPAFVAQSKDAPESETRYEDWVDQWQDALIAFPKRAGRSEGYAYRGPVDYTVRTATVIGATHVSDADRCCRQGPMCEVDPAQALPSAECSEVRAAPQPRGPLSAGPERAKF